MKFLIREKPINLLLSIENRDTGTKLCKKTDITIAHIHKVLKQMLESKLLIKEVEGRCVYYTLTIKGAKFQEETKSLFQEKDEK